MTAEGGLQAARMTVGAVRVAAKDRLEPQRAVLLQCCPRLSNVSNDEWEDLGVEVGEHAPPAPALGPLAEVPLVEL